jgi:hypothetical protein
MTSIKERPNRGAAEWVDKINTMIKLTHDQGRIRYIFPPSRDHEWAIRIEEIKYMLRQSGNVVSTGVYVKQMQPCGYQDFLDIAWTPRLVDRYHQWKDQWLGSVKYE